jgi:hypothetical protein
LEPQDGGKTTLLKYIAGAQIGGKLAQIGSRLVEGSAKKMADEFFAAFAEKVQSAAAVETPQEPALEAALEQIALQADQHPAPAQPISTPSAHADAHHHASPPPAAAPAAESLGNSRGLMLLGGIVVVLLLAIIALLFF